MVRLLSLVWLRLASQLVRSYAWSATGSFRLQCRAAFGRLRQFANLPVSCRSHELEPRSDDTNGRIAIIQSNMPKTGFTCTSAKTESDRPNLHGCHSMVSGPKHSPVHPGSIFQSHIADTAGTAPRGQRKCWARREVPNLLRTGSDGARFLPLVEITKRGGMRTETFQP